MPKGMGRGSNLTHADRVKGGKTSSGNFKFNPERARIAGRKGGQARAKAYRKK